MVLTLHLLIYPDSFLCADFLLSTLDGLSSAAPGVSGLNRFNTTVSQAAAAAAASNDSFTSINISPGLIKRVPKVEPGKSAQQLSLQSNGVDIPQNDTNT